MTALKYSTVLFVITLLFGTCFRKIDSKNEAIVEIPPNLTNVDGDIEHQLAYWREDIGLNSFHWQWHAYQPVEGPKFITGKHRSGELFYYLHQQIMARYNVERHCLGMRYMPSVWDWEAPFQEAYFPMLTSDIAGRKWSSRSKNMTLSDLYRPDYRFGPRVYISDMKLSEKRILEAIDRRKVIDANGTEICIDNDQGIDILGDALQAILEKSPNLKFYGNLHASGHAMLGYIHDPQMQHKQPPGVMAILNTSLRDPAFFNWHAFVNKIFKKHKDMLAPYEEKVLSFPQVQVINVELCSHRNGQCKREKNTLYTYMMKSDINMSSGVDFFPKKPFLVRVTHLNHDEYDYTIEYVNLSRKQLIGTVRIFLLPVTRPDKATMKLSEQRFFNIEMDRFVQILKPGVNRIVRKSRMSSLTIPFEQTFRDLDTNRPKDDEYEKLDKFNACGCGWPQHLLVPRGTPNGYPMLLFAIITDYRDEQISSNENESENNCKIGRILCGVRYGKKYPYKRSSGFPFDRPIGGDNIEDFLKSNMAIKPITIFHSSKVRRGQVLSNAEPTFVGSNLPRE